MAHGPPRALPPLGALSIPAWAARRVVRIAAGDSLAIVEDDWIDAIVLLEEGTVDLECHRGGRRRFEAGAVLWFTGLSLRAAHNAGTGTVVLVAVSRRR